MSMITVILEETHVMFENIIRTHFDAVKLMFVTVIAVAFLSFNQAHIAF